MPVETLTEPEALEWLEVAASCVPEGQAIVELGTYRGGSLKYLVAGAPDSVQVFGVDAWGQGDIYRGRPHMLDRYRLTDKRVAARVAKGATLIHNTTVQAAAEYDGPPVGCLYIDAEHRFDSVIADYQAWAPHLTPDAVVAFDDYGGTKGKQVIQAVDHLIETGRLVWVEKIGERLAITRPA